MLLRRFGLRPDQCTAEKGVVAVCAHRRAVPCVREAHLASAGGIDTDQRTGPKHEDRLVLLDGRSYLDGGMVTF